MKKNKMMRFASALLVLTLLSTCAISGTFAKYVTTDSSADTARVAKFGVEIKAADNSNFDTEYTTDDDGYEGTLSVQSSDTNKVVAPGTSSTPTSGNSEESGALTFTIKGTPEVATKVDIDMTVNSDIVVPAGDYLDWTTGGDAEDMFKVTDDYYPVVFTLRQDGVEVASGNLAAIEEAIETYANTAYYAPNTKLDAEFTLDWEWVFTDEANEMVDKADTLLGNNIAGIAEDADVKTLIDYKIDFTVRQVD